MNLTFYTSGKALIAQTNDRYSTCVIKCVIIYILENRDWQWGGELWKLRMAMAKNISNITNNQPYDICGQNM